MVQTDRSSASETQQAQGRNAHGLRSCGGLAWAVPLSIFCCALAVRLVFLLEDSHSPFFLHRGTDVVDYHFRALAFLKGTYPAPRPFFWPPLYPLFLGILYKIVGQGVWTLKVIHCLIGSASCVLVWAIGRRVFAGRFVPIAAAGMCVLCGTLVFFDGQLLSGSLDVFLQLASIWLLIVALQRDRIGLWIAAGLCLGLSAINRGGTLLFLPVVLVWMYVSIKRGWGSTAGEREKSTGQTPCHRSPTPGGGGAPSREGGGPRGFRKPALAILLAVCAVVLPVSWHNVRYDRPPNPWSEQTPPKPLAPSLGRFLTGGFAFISSNAGLNFYLGNHWALNKVINVNHPDCFARYWQVRNMPKRHGIAAPGEQSWYLIRTTFSDIFANPTDWLKVMGLKAFQLLHGPEIPRDMNLYAARQYSVVLSRLLWKRGIALPMGVIIPLGLVGGFLARRELDRHFLLLGCLAAQASFILAFFVTARYRLPMIPLLSLYAAFALETLTLGIWKRQHARLIAPVGLLAAFLLVSNFRIGKMRTTHGAYEYDWLALAMERENRWDQAIAYLRAALQIEPSYSPSHLHLGTALFHLGHLQGAVAELSKAVEGFSEAGGDSPMLAEAQENLGRALVKTGKADQAVKHFFAALRLEPDNQGLRDRLVATLATLGRWKDAIKVARQALQRWPEQPELLDRLAQLLVRCPDRALSGDRTEAVRLAERACTLTRHKIPTLLETLAAAYRRIGQAERAAAVDAEARQLIQPSSRNRDVSPSPAEPH